MKRYTFKIYQDFDGYVDDQNVWTRANTKEEAINQTRREYHSIVDIILIGVE